MARRVVPKEDIPRSQKKSIREILQTEKVFEDPEEQQKALDYHERQLKAQARKRKAKKKARKRARASRKKNR